MTLCPFLFYGFIHCCRACSPLAVKETGRKFLLTVRGWRLRMIRKSEKIKHISNITKQTMCHNAPYSASIMHSLTSSNIAGTCTKYTKDYAESVWGWKCYAKGIVHAGIKVASVCGLSTRDRWKSGEGWCWGGRGCNLRETCWSHCVGNACTAPLLLPS